MGIQLCEDAVEGGTGAACDGVYHPLRAGGCALGRLRHGGCGFGFLAAALMDHVDGAGADVAGELGKCELEPLVESGLA